MADKPSPGSALFHKDHHKEVIYFVLPGLLILSILLNRLFAYLDSLRFSGLEVLYATLISWFLSFWSVWTPLALILSIGAVAWGIYSVYKLRQIEEIEEAVFGHPAGITFLQTEEKSKETERWEKILAHAHSENPGEWRLAIIEADVMLEELLRASGYVGEGIGEMLKSVGEGDMIPLDEAWEAHKVRNRIAHDGQSYELTERETHRVISLFEKIFREAGLI